MDRSSTNSLGRYEASPPDDLLEAWKLVFLRQRAFAEHAFDQLDLEGFFRVLAPGINSVGTIAQHMAGNMLSRWTDFLTTDGEKSTRNRDEEFAAAESTPQARTRILGLWANGWDMLNFTLEALSPDDLSRTVLIRSVPHPVHAAIVRQIDHYAFHVGQINVIARMIVGTDRWNWFTIPPGGSAAFNASMRSGPGPRLV
jgi:hypothetical protein